MRGELLWLLIGYFIPHLVATAPFRNAIVILDIEVEVSFDDLCGLAYSGQDIESLVFVSLALGFAVFLLLLVEAKKNQPIRFSGKK